jgi:PTH2 family peptidyl-tRNA hydrolase
MQETSGGSDPSDKPATYVSPPHTGIDPELIKTGVVRGPGGKSDNELKVWVIVREDTGMSFGKAIAQTGHAFTTVYAITHYFDDMKAYKWLNSGQPKLSKRAKNKNELMKAFEACRAAGLVTVLVEDEGRTEFEGVKTVTAACVGPCLFEELPKAVQRLQLIKEEIVDFSSEYSRLPQWLTFLFPWKRNG